MSVTSKEGKQDAWLVDSGNYPEDDPVDVETYSRSGIMTTWQLHMSPFKNEPIYDAAATAV